MCCSVLWVNITVTSRPSVRGPDQLSPLLSFKTCLIGVPECLRRGKERASLLRALVFQREGGEGVQGSLISHRWTPPVAINQSQSLAGARRGSMEGGWEEGSWAWSLLWASLTPSHRKPQQTDTNTPSSPPSSSPRVYTSTTPPPLPLSPPASSLTLI